MNMRGKTKYFIIVLLLGLAISSLVGFSSWNIHVQEVFDSPFEYYENASSFIEDYITINGKRIDGETEIKAPLNKTTDNKGESTANDEQETRVTATGYPYSVTINDKDLNEQDSVEQVKWSEWKKNGLTFTYNYYQTSEYTASKDDATGKTVWSYGVLSKNVVIGSGAPKNAGGYVCVITAGVTEGATDSAKRAAENLNISTKTVNGQTFENYAAIIEFRIIQQETSATEPQYTYQEKAADENQNGTQSLSLRTNALYKALRTANNGLFESTAQNPATTQSGKMTTTTQELTYGGKNYELSITANFASDTPILNGDDVTIKFDFPDGFKADDEEHNAIARIVNVKDGKENPNYNLVNPFATYKIKKRFVKISEWQNLTELTYNGQEQKPTPTLEGYSAENQTGVPASDDVNVKALQFDTKNNVYTDIDAWTNAGSYTVKALLYGADSENYEIVYKDDENPVKDFIIEKASIAPPQADGSTFTYNGEEQIYVPTIDGTSASEVTGCSSENVVTVSGDKRTSAGTQIVTITLNDKINYKWADTEDDSEEASVDKTFEFIINKRAISVTIINQESTYGNEIVDLSPVENTTYTVAKNATVTDDHSAIVSGDNASDIFTISVKDSDGNVLTAASNVGKYDITGTQSGNKTVNYTVTFIDGTYTINKREITVNIEDKSSTYGDALKDLTATTDDAVANKDGLDNIFTLSTTAESKSNVGDYTITLTQTGSKTGNYTVTFTDGTYTINKREITVNIEDKSSTYGDEIKTLTATTDDTVADADGLYNIVSLSVKDSDGNVLTAASNVGKYDITGTQSGNKTVNYTVTFIDGTYTINKREITVNIEDKSSTYGDALKDLTATTDDAVANKDGLDNIFTLSTTAESKSNVGDYTITLTQTGSKTGNYTVTFTDGTYTINKREITVNIEDKSSTYGDEIKTLTATTTDKVANTDGLSDILTLSTTATSTSNAGTYAIEGTQKNEGVALNYDVEFVGTYGEDKQQGTYTIEKAGFKSITVIPYSQEYDGKNHSLFTLTVVTATGDEITVENDETLKKSGLTVDILLSGSWQTIGKNDIVWPNSTAVYTLDVSVKVSDDNHVVSDPTETKTAEIKKVTYSIPSTTATFTYNGTAQGEAFINALTNYDANNKYTLTFKDANGKTIDKTKIVDAGNYKAIFTLTDKTNYQWADNTNTDKTIKWSIAKLKIKFDGVIEINYNENGFSYNEDLLKGYLIVSGTSQSFNEYFNGVTPSKVFESADATDGNGHDRSLTTTYNGKVGSTYNITATATDNYEFVTDGNIIYLKYKTVYVNGNTSTYYTIEEAVALSGSTAIVLAANKTGVVETWFTSTGYYSGTEYYTLSAKDLIVPYIDDSGSVVTASTTNNSTAGTTGVHAALCIPEGVTLTVSKTLNIVAYVACVFPDISRVYQHGVVMNYGTIKVESGGKILAYGYLKGSGNGLVKLESGSSATDLFRAYDYLGGAATYTLTYTHWFPINSYTFHNISCKTDIYPGATYQTSYRIYVPTAESWTDELFLKLVSNSNDALFTLKSGYVTKYAVNAAKVNSTDSTALTTIGGSNQIKGQKDVIELHGVANDNTISVTVKISIASQSITTGVNTPLPLPYLDIVVCKGASLTLTANSYKFMPGTSMTIEEDATLTTANTSQLVFYTEAQCSKEEQFSSGDGYNYYTKYCVDKSSTELGTYDAKLIVNGTANIPGRVSGKILTNSDSAKTSLTIGTASTQILVIESFTSVSTSDLIGGIFGVKPDYTERQTALMSATGNLVNGNKNNGTIPYAENANLSSNTKYNSVLANSENKTYAWYVIGTYAIQFETQVDTLSAPAQITAIKGATLTDGNLPNLKNSRPGYTFLGWYTAEKGGMPAVGNAFYSDLTLYAQWEAIIYDIEFNADGVVNNPSSVTITHDDNTYYNKLPPLTAPVDGYVFIGWFDSAGKEYTENSTVSITANLKLFAKWQVKITLNANDTEDAPAIGNTEPIWLNKGAKVTNLPTLVRTGFIHIGWSDKNGTIIGQDYTADAPQTLDACWKEKTTTVYITYDYNYEGSTPKEGIEWSADEDITEPATRKGYVFDGWFDNAIGGTKVTNISTYKDSVTENEEFTLYAHWTVITYKVYLDCDGGTIDDVEQDDKGYYVEVNYDDNTFKDLVNVTITKAGYTFQGWLYNGDTITSTTSVSDYLGDTITEITLVAQWQIKSYTVKFVSDNTDYVWDASMTNRIEFGETIYFSKDVPNYGVKSFNTSDVDYDVTKTKYFTGWSCSVDETVYTDSFFIPDYEGDTITFTAQWTQKDYTIKITVTDATVAVTSNGKTYSTNSETTWHAMPNQKISISVSYTNSDDQNCSITMDNKEQNLNSEFAVTSQVTVTASSSSCLVEGTLITLADGTKKKVEDVTSNDTLLIFNHETGTYDFAKVLFNDSEPVANYTVINLQFSNGSVVKVVSEHGFFDITLNKYVYIDDNNYVEFIGHKFYSATYDGSTYNDTIVTLDKAYLTTEYVRVYSPVTKYHLNYFTEDLLSMPGGIEGLFNIFEYGDGLKYDEEAKKADLELYGELTYEDFKDLVSLEMYESYPANYFGVAIGKGILTWDKINYYIDRYGPLTEESQSEDPLNSEQTSSTKANQTAIPPSSSKKSFDSNDEDDSIN